MYGKGLLKGLSITMKNFFGRAITQQYPEVKPNLPPRSHGFFNFSLDKCIACGLCAKSCPNEVIELNSEKGADKKKVLTEFKMELGYCLFCGLCTEVCPTDALNSSTDFELSCFTRDATVYDFLNKSGEGHSKV